MIHNLMRCFGHWLWAMYLVAIILWGVALALSLRFYIEGFAEFGTGREARHVVGLEHGVLRMTWVRSHGVDASTGGTFVLPGFEAFWTPMISGWIGQSFYVETRITFQWWAVTGVLIVPWLLAAIVAFRRPRTTTSGGGTKAGVLATIGRLCTGGSIWLIVLIAALICIGWQDSPDVEIRWGTRHGAMSYETGTIYLAASDGTLRGDLYHNYPEPGWTGPASIRFMGVQIDTAPGEFIVHVPLWIVFVLLVVSPLLSLIAHLRHRPIEPGCCQRCGYDLRGAAAVGAACPECGTKRIANGATTVG